MDKAMAALCNGVIGTPSIAGSRKYSQKRNTSEGRLRISVGTSCARKRTVFEGDKESEARNTPTRRLPVPTSAERISVSSSPPIGPLGCGPINRNLRFSRMIMLSGTRVDDKFVPSHGTRQWCKTTGGNRQG